MRKLYSFILLTMLCSTSGLFGQQTYFSKSTGRLDQENTWGPNTDGSGTQPTNFTSGDVFVICNRTSADISFDGSWGLGVTSTIVVGDGTNSTEFIINEFEVISGAGIIVANAGTLTINADSPLSIFTNTAPFYSLAIKTSTSVGSTVIYNTGGNNGTSTVVPLQYGNLSIIENSVLDGNTIVAGNLHVENNKVLDLNAKQLTLNGLGTLSGTGLLSAATSTILLATNNQITGDLGSLRLSGSPAAISMLDVNIDASSRITLGTDVQVNGNFQFRTGDIDLNGHILRLSCNQLNFGSSAASPFFRGSSTSEIHVGGTGAIQNSFLRLHSTSNDLGVFSFNRTGRTITVDSRVNIRDSLSVINGIVNANNNVTIKSSTTSKARISRVGGTLSGSITVEAVIDRGLTDWALFGAPGVSGQTFKSWDNYPTNGVPMTCIGCQYLPAQAGGFTSISDWDEPQKGFVNKAATDPLVPGKGYWVYAGTGFSNTAVMTLSNTGLAVTGATNITITQSHGFLGDGEDGLNLVSNPYASPISWRKLQNINSADIGATMYIYNPNFGMGSMLTSGVTSPSGNNMTDTIPIGQGFYVEFNSFNMSASLTFAEDMKVDNSKYTDVLRTTADKKDPELMRLRVRSNSGEKDETVIYVDQNATEFFDGRYDARKMFSVPGYAGFSGPYDKFTTISTKDKENKDYSINGIGLLEKNMSIPVLVRVSATGSYTIDAFDYDNFNSCMILKDKLENVYHDLRKGPYVCTIKDTTSKARFELVLCQSESGPVSVKELNAANHITISQDSEGTFVHTNFPNNTEAVISVYNIVGQEIMKETRVLGTENTTRLNIPVHNQVVLIRVTSDNQSVTKKLIAK